MCELSLCPHTCTLYAIQDRVDVSVSVDLRVAWAANTLCVLELVLESLDGPHFGFHVFDDRGVFGEQEQREMVRLSRVGERCDFVGVSYTGVNMVQSFMFPCGVGNWLMKLWKYRSQSTVIEVTTKAPSACMVCSWLIAAQSTFTTTSALAFNSRLYWFMG